MALEKSDNDNISNGVKSNKSSSNDNNSKSSKDQVLKDELNKISEELRVAEETYLTDPEQFGGIGVTDDNNSETSSSFGFINNLAEKMKIFGEDTHAERTASTRRKPIGRKRDATTKKKQVDKIIDENTTVELTRLSFNETMNDSKISYEFVEAVDLY
eukprot:GHVR01030628.1.p1 GENE.GHVR01030628.1~~GHVR01030628.1.p1  ORF type:complete len:158 (+),score=27.19 GHVR01030628.1:999-1472(+)